MPTAVPGPDCYRWRPVPSPGGTSATRVFPTERRKRTVITGMADHDLSGFERTSFTHGGTARDVLRRGEGPAVIVMAEIPGITPKVLEFAERVAAIGCTAVLPVLFGDPGRDPAPAAHGRLRSGAYFASAFAKVCVSREFTVLATGRSSPVVTWLRALAADEHERCGGPGVGAVGMCLTGGFALAMATDERLLAPVLSQPSLPLPVTARRRATTDISDEELAVVKERCARDGLRVIGMRSPGTAWSPGTGSRRCPGSSARRSPPWSWTVPTPLPRRSPRRTPC